MIPNIHIGQTEVYFLPLLTYYGMVLIGAAFNFFYQLYTISSKKKAQFNWLVFIGENWLSTLSGVSLSIIVVTGLLFSGLIGLENSYAHNALAITLGASVDGAITYYFDHIVKK